MILADEGTAALWGFAAAGFVAVVTQIGSMIVKRMRGPEVATREDKLMIQWAGIADEATQELAECRAERQRQDARIDRLEHDVAELRGEVNQWRNGQRVPDGYVLQRAPLPPHREEHP